MLKQAKDVTALKKWASTCQHCILLTSKSTNNMIFHLHIFPFDKKNDLITDGIFQFNRPLRDFWQSFVRLLG